MTVETHPFLDQLHKHYEAITPNNRMDQQSQAWKKFLSIGLPTRHDEAYRYVRLANVWKPKTPVHNASETQIRTVLQDQPPTATRLVFVDGIYRADLSDRSYLPKNIVVNDLKTSFIQYGPFLDTQWNALLKNETDPFTLLNAACTQGALFLYIPPNSILNEPIEILHLITGSKSIVFPRMHAVFGRCCEVTLVSKTLTLNSSACTVSSCLEGLVEDEARVNYIEPPLPKSLIDAQRFDALRIRLKRSSSFRASTAVIGGALIRKSWHAGLCGEGAEVYLEGALCLSEEQQAHINILVEHEAPHCKSQQLFKSALNDASRMSFGGNILVRRPAQKTEAYQLNHNLLLGKEAHVDSTPCLEIFADDVKASHGATVGQLDQEQLLYFLTRGIPLTEARKLLLAGFFEPITAAICLKEMREAIQMQLEEAIV